MDIKPSFLFGKVAHTRILPVKNSFVYRIFYIAVDIGRIKDIELKPFLSVNHAGLMSFYESDHGMRDGSPLTPWIRKILLDHDMGEIDGRVILITMPRILGYVFNPVSFWLCYDNEKNLRAVLCEVNNTFGETHSYLCRLSENYGPKTAEYIEGQKVFHVSPFLPREGSYRFRFNVQPDKTIIQIDYHDLHGNKQLITSINVKSEAMSLKSCKKAFFGYPLLTLRSIYLIHWQALKLWMKRQKYYSKPIQTDQKVTIIDTIKKM